MGLSIHYSGRIKDAASLPLLIEEVKEIANTYGWEYRIAESVFPDNTLNDHEYLSPIYGISFTPPECETISLTFISNGVMACSSGIYLFGNSKNATERDYIYRLFAKTQFAGVEVHALIINIFRYLSKKYLSEFKMNDEGEYWETGDEDVLREKFKEYDALLDNFMLSFQTFPIEKGEDLMNYFDRLLEHINRLKRM